MWVKGNALEGKNSAELMNEENNRSNNRKLLTLVKLLPGRDESGF
jgi:hypothetical protein